MLAAGDTAKKVILKVRELINNKKLFAFLLLVRVLLYVLIIMITRMPQSLNSTGALIGLIFVQELCGVGHCF